MKVLLTGANGFVGSHIVDLLLQSNVETAVLLRPRSSRQFIESQLSRLDIRLGAIDDPASLREAMKGITHVIHCAGCTKALSREEFFKVNQAGTRHVVDAANAAGISRLVHISSLAVAGPSRMARETDELHAITDYGQSKAAGELEVIQHCRSEYAVLRPPAVYGPRDGEFLRLFKAVESHLLPVFGGGRQELSMVYVCDLAAAAVAALHHPKAAGQVFYVAADEVVTARQLASIIASVMNVRTVTLPLPNAILWPVCALQELISRCTGKANVLNRQKYPELAAPAWVCHVSKLQQQMGFRCPTMLRQGVEQTLAWYRKNGWLKSRAAP